MVDLRLTTILIVFLSCFCQIPAWCSPYSNEKDAATADGGQLRSDTNLSSARLSAAHNITVRTGPGGTAIPSGDCLARPGKEFTIKIKPDQGCKIQTIVADDRRMDKMRKRLTIKKVNEDHEINISFAPKELRAIFDEGVGWTTEEGARSTIERISKAGFNVYVPCVWHGGGTRYPSHLAPAEEGLNFEGEDPLARLIQLAHANGIFVHPWITVTLRQKDFYPQFHGEGSPPNAFDVQRPQFRNFIVDLISDIVERYDVDGVNLDYIRTMGTCSCDYCRDEYRRRFGRDLNADLQSGDQGGALESHLQQWVDAAVEEIVRNVSIKCKALKPALQLSVDGHPTVFANREGRNEIKWANDGLIDIIFNIDYGRLPNFNNHRLMRRQLENPSKLLMLLSNCQNVNGVVVPKHAVIFANNVKDVRKRWKDGFGAYLYSMLSDEQLTQLSELLNK